VADNPPPTSVVTRAWQLLPELWKSGQPGGRKTEQTQGRWITYLATAQGAKRAVVAYRLKDPIAAATPPASAPKPQQPLILTATPTNGLATLRQGSTGPAVSKAQALLGIAADGKFGPGTKAAVVAFQTGHGLTPDGVIGPATWQALTIRAA
jgi:peptidoglycan hydrolase-like protein with peptidoglycan-binding domain